uniref:PWI domain-containing protein n=1 Tax=Clastoptera arizonana TaxID=38151 RepID=A0A1B6CCS8_9HEMI
MRWNVEGTTAEQDNRFSDKEKKLLKQMKFGDCLTRRVDMTKVKLDTIKPWIAQKITEVLGIEDDVVVHFVFNQLESKVLCNSYMFDYLIFHCFCLPLFVL